MQYVDLVGAPEPRRCMPADDRALMTPRLLLQEVMRLGGFATAGIAGPKYAPFGDPDEQLRFVFQASPTGWVSVTLPAADLQLSMNDIQALYLDGVAARLATIGREPITMEEFCKAHGADALGFIRGVH